MRLILNYKCKQCCAIFSGLNILLKNDDVTVYNISLTEGIALGFSSEYHSNPIVKNFEWFIIHDECNIGHGLAEFVGWEVED